MRASKSKRRRKLRAKERNHAKYAAALERQQHALETAHLRPTRMRRLLGISSRGVSLKIPFNDVEVPYDPADPVSAVEKARKLGKNWQDEFMLPQSEDTREALRSFHDELGRLRAAKEIPQIDALLRSLAERSDTVPPVLLVAALRLTYLYRDELRSWEPARDKIAEGLRHQGHDPAALLVGLGSHSIGDS